MIYHQMTCTKCGKEQKRSTNARKCIKCKGKLRRGKRGPLKVKATPIKSEVLAPGDLFSTASQAKWDLLLKLSIEGGDVGQRVFIRTDAPCPTGQIGLDVFKIEIER